MRRSRRSASPGVPLPDTEPKPLVWTDFRRTRWSNSKLSSWSTQRFSRLGLVGCNRLQMPQNAGAKAFCRVTRYKIARIDPPRRDDDSGFDVNLGIIDATVWQ